MNEENATLKKILLVLIIISSLSLMGILGWFIYDQSISNKKDSKTPTTVEKIATTTTINVPETFSLNFDSPLDKSTVSGTVLVKVTVGGDEDIDKVELYVDNELNNSTTEYAYTFDLDTTTLSTGTHTLKAIAYDINGQTATKEITVVK